jgi:hypothetical protein
MEDGFAKFWLNFGSIPQREAPRGVDPVSTVDLEPDDG